MIQINCFIYLFFFLDWSATFNQRQDHLRDPRSDGVPVRTAHHTQRPEARKHLGWQGLSHQGTASLRRIGHFHSSTSTVRAAVVVLVRLQTLGWPPVKRGASSPRRSPAEGARREDPPVPEEPAHWATWLPSIWTASIPSPPRSPMSTALPLWFGSFSQRKSHMQVSLKSRYG